MQMVNNGKVSARRRGGQTLLFTYVEVSREGRGKKETDAKINYAISNTKNKMKSLDSG